MSAADDGPGTDAAELGRQVELTVWLDRVAVPFTVHLRRIELMTDVDVVVSSENVYLEPSKTFSHTVSASLRRAAATRGPSGEILDDLVGRELAAWMGKHGRPGLPVRPGTVVPTSAGALAAGGIRRIFHVAVAAPLPHRDRYAVEPGAIADGVRNVFTLATQENAHLDRPLAAICFPMLGAGHGGLAADTSAAWLVWSIADALRAHPAPAGGWRLHVATCEPDHAAALVRRLGQRGAGAPMTGTGPAMF